MKTLSMAWLLFPLTLCASWPQWRGPTGQGHAEGKLPLSWSETENVAWKTPTPGRGWSSPVVHGKQVWLTTAFETEGEAIQAPKADAESNITPGLAKVDLHALCLDIETGKIVHDVPIFSINEPQLVHQRNSYASPAPVIEEGAVYLHFGTYGTAAIATTTGEVLWRNTELVINHENGPGSCPILWTNHLIFHMDGSDKQYIVALDKSTGAVAWRTDRSGTLNENPQLKKAYGTPLMATLGDQEQLISNAADWLYAYDPASGKELWKMPYERLGFSNVARPVIGHGMIYLATGFSKSEMFAIRADGKGAAQVEWTFKRNVPTGPSPILVGDELYFVSDQGGLVTCLDAKSGDLVWRDRIEGANFWASPMHGDGKLYFFAEEGITTVIKPGKALVKLSENQLDGAVMGSPAAADNALFIRTDKALYRISQS